MGPAAFLEAVGAHNPPSRPPPPPPPPPELLSGPPEIFTSANPMLW
jgi:hypothetical protein